MSRCKRDQISACWSMSPLKHIEFHEHIAGVLDARCGHCGAISINSKLSNAKKITDALEKEIATDHSAFIEAHKNCVWKEVEKAEEPTTEPTLEYFPTGSVRDSQVGRGRFDLIPPGPTKRLALRYEMGAAKYGDSNWQKGQPISRYIGSALRHINQYQLGDTSEDHLSAASWNLFAAMWTEDEIKAGRLKL